LDHDHASHRRGILRSVISVIADGGPTHGLGHLARSSAVAAALRARGLSLRAYAHGATEPRTFDGIDWEPLSDPPSGAIVLDSYTLNAAALEPLAYFHDGQADLPPSAKVIIASGPEREGWLGGLRHAPLRAAYWGLPPRTPRPRIERVLVTTGGGVLQPPGLRMAAAVREALPDASVALVKGPLADFEAPPGVALVNAPPSLLGEHLRADVVVSAAGQTALEAVATGAATVAVPLVANQQANARALDAAGAAVVVAEDEVGEAVASLDRAALARRGQAAVDGFGALRIAFQIAALLA
jgi:spore coat polysaccharide biosynthesis predicted glycosyltransferase SpsG